MCHAAKTNPTAAMPPPTAIFHFRLDVGVPRVTEGETGGEVASPAGGEDGGIAGGGVAGEAGGATRTGTGKGGNVSASWIFGDRSAYAIGFGATGLGATGFAGSGFGREGVGGRGLGGSGFAANGATFADGGAGGGDGAGGCGGCCTTALSLNRACIRSQA
jgi:hypothetical protein